MTFFTGISPVVMVLITAFSIGKESWKSSRSRDHMNTPPNPASAANFALSAAVSGESYETKDFSNVINIVEVCTSYVGIDPYSVDKALISNEAT